MRINAQNGFSEKMKNFLFILCRIPAEREWKMPCYIQMDISAPCILRHDIYKKELTI